LKKTSQLLAYADIGMVIFLSVYVILVLYDIIIANIFIPITLALIYIIYMLCEKKDTTKVKMKSIITILPILCLAITASIKKFM
jgi:hypothetical protein